MAIKFPDWETEQPTDLAILDKEGLEYYTKTIDGKLACDNKQISNQEIDAVLNMDPEEDVHTSGSITNKQIDTIFGIGV